MRVASAAHELAVLRKHARHARSSSSCSTMLGPRRRRRTPGTMLSSRRLRRGGAVQRRWPRPLGRDGARLGCGTAATASRSAAAVAPRRKREHAQQRHREARVLVGREPDVAARPAPRSDSRAAAPRHRSSAASSRSVARVRDRRRARACGTICTSASRCSSVPRSCSAISNERLRLAMRSASAISAGAVAAPRARCRIACRYVRSTAPSIARDGLRSTSPAAVRDRLVEQATSASRRLPCAARAISASAAGSDVMPSASRICCKPRLGSALAGSASG